MRFQDLRARRNPLPGGPGFCIPIRGVATIAAMSEILYTSSEEGRIQRLLPDLVRHRGLLLDLVSKELRARYRNAMIGFAWAVLQPLLFTLILTFVFVTVFNLKEVGGRDTPSSILCGIVFWQFFATAAVTGTNSLIENKELIKKVHFPREAIPLAAILNCLVNLAIGLVVLVLVCLVRLGGCMDWPILLVPFLLLLQIGLVTGVALLFSAINVHFQDVAYFLDIALTFGFYASPILYPIDRVAHHLGPDSLLYHLYMLNPMAGIISAYKDMIVGGQWPDPALLVWPAVCTVLLLVAGAITFRRLSPRFVDFL